MKKLLLASTALVLSAGVAAAEVKLSGDARMGLVYDGDDVLLTSRARVTFTMSGETDTGLAFGASFRADNAVAAAGNTRMTGGNVFISGDFGKLSMGDVAGAARAAVGDLYGVGLTGLGDLNDMTYIDRNPLGLYTFNRRTAALYEYKIDAFTLYASVSQTNVLRGPGNVNPTNVATVFTGSAGVPLLAGQTYREQQYAIGAKYSFDGLTVSAGYEMLRVTSTGFASFSANHLVGGVEYSMDNFKVKAIAGRAGGDLGTILGTPGFSRTQYGVSGQASFDATTVTAFANRNFATTDFGIGVSYDLGGGAKLMGGVAYSGSNNTLGIGSNTTADFGLSFSF